MSGRLVAGTASDAGKIVVPAEVPAADLAEVPGTKATVGDLAWLQATGLDRAPAERAGHADTAALDRLIDQGGPPGLPFLSPGPPA